MTDDGLYKKLSGYDLIVFDMDGTLYYQRGMQINMAFRLIGHALFEGGLKDLRLILKYRKLREDWDASKKMNDEDLYASLSEETGKAKEDIRQTIRTWMFEKPMDVVSKCRDEKLVKVIEQLISDGKQVCIYSDYPTEDKVRAVGLPSGIPQYYCGQEDIRTMKPNPSGLFYIMSRYPSVLKDKVIMVGDRADRDGAVADNAGTASLIVGRFRLLRYLF
ncbi:MAG: HAD family hydrolase [Lachnospiraceae bacterium]|nr:HAD family hydrolase [Lachnospiraceae bacterium]